MAQPFFVSFRVGSKSVGLEEGTWDSVSSCLPFQGSSKSCSLRSSDFPFSVKTLPLSFCLFLFLTCLMQSCTGSWFCLCSSVMQAHSFPFKWQAGHNLFTVHQTLSLVGKDLRFLDCCLRDVYLPSAIATPHTSNSWELRKEINLLNKDGWGTL